MTATAQPLSLAFVSGGAYLRGCTAGQQPCSGPAAQSVTLDDFAIGQYEVTQSQYQAVMGNNPSAEAGCPGCPVEQVSWYDAVLFCNQLSLQEGLQPAYFRDPQLSEPFQGLSETVYWDTASKGYRLPTEAEWEYAARGGPALADTRYAGSDVWAAVAVAGDGTQEVGSRSGNSLGLFDLSGNVAEWCWDWRGDYPTFATCNPRGVAEGPFRAVRGGSFLDTEGFPLAKRGGAAPENNRSSLGFRVARSSSFMRRIEGGTFTMGCTPEQSPDCQNDEFPAHTLTLSSFLLSRFELTQAEWAALMPEYSPLYNRGEGSDLPTYRVSWYDAATYCNRRSLQEGLEPAYYFDPAFTEVFDSLVGDQLAYVDIYWKKSAGGYRFPTEAEWEFAARGGNLSEGYRYAGSNQLDAVAWHSGNAEDTTYPVGQKQPNELGLYDMTGNIYEWCWDWYASGYYSNSPANDPAGPETGTLTCIRGGSWISSESGSRVANRLNFLPGARRTTFGFRLARNAN